jgi:WD40 repeat protein
MNSHSISLARARGSVLVALIAVACGAPTPQRDPARVPVPAPDTSQPAPQSATLAPPIASSPTPAQPAAEPAPVGSPIQLVPQKGHTAAITSADWSKDSRFILTGSADGTARLWDSRSQILLRVFAIKKNELFQNKEQVRYAVLIPDGKRVALLDNEDIVHVFDLATGALLQTIPTKANEYAQPRATRIRAFSDGRRVIVSRENAPLSVVDLDTGHRQSPTGNAVAGAPRLDRDRAVLARSGSEKKEAIVQIYDRARQAVVATHPVAANVYRVAVSPDDKTIAMLLLDATFVVGTIELRDLDTWRLLGSLENGIGGEANLTFSPDGSKLVVPADRTSVAIYDVATRRRVANLSSRDAWGLRSIAERPTSWKVAVASGDGNAYLFDIANAALERTFDAHVQYVTALDYSADGRYLATNDLTNPGRHVEKAVVGARIWDATTGAQIWKTVGSHDLIRVARFSDDGKLVIIGDRNRLVVRDTKRMQTISTIAFDHEPTSITFSRDATEVAIASDSHDDGFFDVRTGRRTGPFPTPRVMHARYLPDGKRVLFAKYPGGVELWEIQKDRKIRGYDGGRWTQDRDMTAAEISADGRRFVGLTKDESLAVWEIETGKVLARLPLADRKLVEATFLPNADYVIAASRSGALRVWNIRTGNTISFLADAGEWIVYTDDGHFDGSRRGGHLVAAVSGLTGYRIDQMAIRNNRPDIILERMGIGSAEIVSHYRSLYERRLRKMGIREGDLEGTFDRAPTVEISASSRQGRTAILEFAARAEHDDLKSYNLYVNDVPIFGSAGKPLSGRYQTLREMVPLSTGENEVEVGVLGARGIESLRPSVSFSVDEKVPSELYVLAFGVSRFANRDLNLKFAAKDATDLVALLGKNGRDFVAVHTRTYTDERVNVQSLGEAKLFLSTAKTDDTVVLFVAGHGLYGSSSRDYYYLTHQTDLEHLAETAVPFERLEDLLQGIAPRKKLFLLDTCYSGEQGQEVGAATFAEAGARGLVSRGIRRKLLDGAGVPRDQHLYAQGDRFIYNDLFRRSGAIVLSSSRGSELSYERDDLENGLFTEFVLRALSTKEADVDKDGRVSTDELRDYVARAVSAASNGLQNPVVDRDNIEVRISLPLQ